MIKRLYKRYEKLLWEIFRYLIVGGFATIVDYGVLILFRELIFPKQEYILGVDWGLATATTLGFICGLTLNYLLSLLFVFKDVKNENSGKSVKDFFIFTLIGVVGLVVTLGGMQLFVEVIGFHYMIVKVIMTVIVLVWNYIARKIFIFK